MLENSQEEPHPIFQAIMLRDVSKVNKIIEEDPSVLEKTNENGDTPIFYAIKLGRSMIAEKIYKKEPLVLEQKDLLGKTPIFHAIALGSLMIVDEIIYQKLSVLEQKDLSGNTPIDLATALLIISSGHNKIDRASRVLKKVLERKFRGNINNAAQEDFKELFLNEMLLKGIYSAEGAPFSLKVLEKAFDKITPESTFKKIYKDLFENVDKNQPIASTKNEDMFIFQSGLKWHSSFFIFHVNKEYGKLTSISYCDGNTIDEGRKIKDSAAHINGVTTFKLNTPIIYSPEFVKNFIEKNSKNELNEDFHNKFINNAIQGVDIDYAKTTHSIPTKIQKKVIVFLKALPWQPDLFRINKTLKSWIMVLMKHLKNQLESAMMNIKNSRTI